MSEKKEFRPYKEAEEFVHSLNIKNEKPGWREYCKSGNKPADIPSAPNLAYKNLGWVSWGNFLGTGSIATKKREFMSLKELTNLVQSEGIKTSIQYKDFCKNQTKHDNIPWNPQQVYTEFTTWGDFLGTGNISNLRKNFVDYNTAKEILQSFNLQSKTDFDIFMKDNGVSYPEIPKGPEDYYKKINQWVNWGDFLGTGNIATFNRKYVNFEECKKYAHDLGFKNQQDWFSHNLSGEKPNDIPARPDQHYVEWTSWPDFLGYNKKYYWGEEQISKILESEGYCKKEDYKGVLGYYIRNCHDTRIKNTKKGKLKFDFAIFDLNDNLLFYIERDGELHFEIHRDKRKSRDEKLKKLKTQQENDILKNKYCDQLGIPLLRITYTMDKDKDFVEKKIKNFIENPETDIEEYEKLRKKSESKYFTNT